MQPTPLEIIESIDINRFLEHGIKVKMVRVENLTYAVDRKSDLKHVQELMKSDTLVADYLNSKQQPERKI